MKLRTAAIWIAAVAAFAAILYQSCFSALYEGGNHRRNRARWPRDVFERSCAWERHQCANDCIRHSLFQQDGLPITAHAWKNTTSRFLENQKERAALNRFGARVACWPSTGGIWIKHALPLDMSFLGLSLQFDTPRPEDLDPVEEDAFCTKLRLIGAEFWANPPNLTDCAPLEACVSPQIRGDLGIAWVHGEAKGTGGAHVVNLTDAIVRRKIGPGMRGYFQAPDMDRRADISEYLGGVWCPREPAVCEKLWCTQYPDYCEEAKILMSDEAMWHCEKSRNGFW